MASPNSSEEPRPVESTTSNDLTTTPTQLNPDGIEQPTRSVQLQGLPLDWTQLGSSSDNLPTVIRYPSDVAEISSEETELCIVGTAGQKITFIGNDFSRTVNEEMQSLILRSHLIRKIEGLQYFTNLQLLELYDNQVEALTGLDSGPNGCPGSTLRVLDMSYNEIRDMEPVSLCPNLRELCTCTYSLDLILERF
jgi:hypothetical protein